MIYKTWTDADNDGAIWNTPIYSIQAANNRELPAQAILLSGGNDKNAVYAAEGSNNNIFFITDEDEAQAEFNALASRMTTPASFQGNTGKIYTYSSVMLSRHDVEYGEVVDTETIDIVYKVSK